MTMELCQAHDRPMQLSSSLSWLVDAAAETPGADQLLAKLGSRLIEDGVPLAGGALTIAVPHPLIARRTWLWSAESGEVNEALGFVAGGLGVFGELGEAGEPRPPGETGRRWLAGLAARLGSWPRIRWCSSDSMTPGSVPCSSTRRLRVSRYKPSASAGRPIR